MRWLVYSCLLALLALVQALSSSGNRLLVVIEEAAEKEIYSHFWDDLEGIRLILFASIVIANLTIQSSRAGLQALFRVS